MYACMYTYSASISFRRILFSCMYVVCMCFHTYSRLTQQPSLSGEFSLPVCMHVCIHIRQAYLPGEFSLPVCMYVYIFSKHIFQVNSLLLYVCMYMHVYIFSSASGSIAFRRILSSCMYACMCVCTYIFSSASASIAHA